MSEARITRATEATTNYVHDAWLYRWLTAEPDPEVVVIDLRETWSVGPPLAVVDRAVDAIVPGVDGATAVRAIERAADVIRRRPVAIASGAVLGAVVVSLLASIADGEPRQRLLLAQIVVAGVAALGLRSQTTLAELRTTRAARLLLAVLEPPEPPGTDSAGDEAHRTGDGTDPQNDTDASEAPDDENAR